ncbi:tyrosine-protein kinase receptor TYRO3 isoform X4 [Syngnathus scovelli]|uniref:tyrosine-protein kinase receptor TYRO3 isoform X4 n=1 Tax=Syngnathus scovelli TaxID=161590 RepID=UPI002110AD34|nr:tyrosine-protein kinase receptor TYRO3 isoform X4 [Syngnathus scovelli]
MDELVLRLALVAVLASGAIGDTTAPQWGFSSGVTFSRHPRNQTVSQGNAVRLGCAVDGVEEPDVVWMKDGARLLSSDQMFIALGEKHWETYHSAKSVQQQDAGQYWCEVDFRGQTLSSERAWITVEGVPHFVQEPQDVATLPGEPFNLTCGAVGPPEPVEVLWWLGGVQAGGATPSPSILRVLGVNNTLKFYCEARNARGISVSRTGTVNIKVLPAAPAGLEVAKMVQSDALLSWQPGFKGHSELSACIVQLQRLSPGRVVMPEWSVAVPPHSHVLTDLTHHSNYSARVSCLNEVGASPFSPWTHFLTPESVPSVAPGNLTFQLLERLLSLRWAELREEELQGQLLAYKLQWILGGERQEPLLFKEPRARLTGDGRFFNASVQVSACTAVGCGPWSPPVVVLPTLGVLAANMLIMCSHHADEGASEHADGWAVSASSPTERNHIWVGVLFALLALTVLALLFSVFARRRGKETQFGWVFPPTGTDTPDSFTAARSFNRNAGDMQVLSCEFGSVREAFLKKDDCQVQKVAVKVLRSDITASGDIEQCLKEAAYMKDFHHPNVIQLIGVSLQRRHAQRLPVPMVVLPFMKHGDLHTFLLLSRLGDQPFDLSAHVLVQFMLDVARGMEYLSGHNIIHRDLAARNCMLDENMVVCVADFGLSKKIYSGDYYRQGSVSKLPVKWIALESLADNIYTTQSDVWAFGVTMWEVMTRGKTPYPGVENSEIYEYLIRGERLKKPAECRQDIYDVMHSCWSPVPKCRPTFQRLVVLLEELRLSFSPGVPCKESLHYVNVKGEGQEGRGASGADGTQEGNGLSVPWKRDAEDEEQDWLMVASEAALAIGGGADYRYIVDPCGGGQGPGVDNLEEDIVHV